MAEAVGVSAPPTTLTDYDSEHRLAVVMYGGVSLAIYIGGIARELLAVIRATAPSRNDRTQAGLTFDQLSPSEKIYRRVAQMTQGVSYDGTEGAAGARLPIKTRVSVDIISGTSAGGINGVFLAKALSNDAPLDAILNLWIEEGDLGKLLNDSESVSDLPGLAAQVPPVALLNGERMYRKLLAAFDDMDRQKNSGRYDPGRVDLFVTTTDIRGEVINLPVENTVAQERRHRQRFHFTHDGSHSGELANAENPTLAYAARCTSSFPFAFEPFTWKDAARLAGPRADQAQWNERLMFTSPNYDQRPMGDGGYLDNKPFSYAIDELARRQSDLEVARTLIYVEPDPVVIDASSAKTEQETKPDAIDNALAALISIPGYETIREDLQRVIERNARVDQFREIERKVEAGLDTWMGLHARDSVVEAVNAKGREATVEELVAKYGPGYAAYHEVKVSSVIDMVADLICVAGSIARPEISQVVRDLVREWVRQTYSTPQNQTELLLDADIDYRLRKLSFLIRKAAPPSSKAIDEVRAQLKKIYDDLYLTRGKLRDALQTWVAGMLTPDAEKALGEIALLKKKQRKARLAEVVVAQRQKGDQLREILSKNIRPQLVASAHAVSAALAGTDADVTKIRHYCERFENYDMVIFPMTQNGGVDEGVEVDIVRVSPRDMRRPHTLQGSKLGHFGGFLEDDWRRNDILWGRLDAAESLICHMIPDDSAERQAIIDEAHRAIVSEQLGADLQKRLTEAAAPKPGAAVLPSAQARQQQLAIAAAAKGCIGNDQLLHDLFVDGGGYDQNMNRDRQLVSTGRAGVIVEKMM